MALDSRMRPSSGYGVSPSWEESENSLNREFLDAVAAVAGAYSEGRLTDEEADELLRLMTALAVEAKANSMVNRFADRLTARYLNEKRIGDLFDSALKS